MLINHRFSTCRATTLFATLITLSASCGGSNATTPQAATFTYSLESLDGRPLPTAGPIAGQIVSGTLILLAADSVVVRETVAASGNAGSTLSTTEARFSVHLIGGRGPLYGGGGGDSLVTSGTVVMLFLYDSASHSTPVRRYRQEL